MKLTSRNPTTYFTHTWFDTLLSPTNESPHVATADLLKLVDFWTPHWPWPHLPTCGPSQICSNLFSWESERLAFDWKVFLFAFVYSGYTGTSPAEISTLTKNFAVNWRTLVARRTSRTGDNTRPRYWWESVYSKENPLPKNPQQWFE